MTYVEGVALDIGWADARLNLPELVFRTVRRALDDAGRDITESKNSLRINRMRFILILCDSAAVRPPLALGLGV